MTGILAEYPYGGGAYDAAVSEGRFTPSIAPPNRSTFRDNCAALVDPVALARCLVG